MGQGVTGANVFQADAGHNVARSDDVEVFPVVGVHLQDAPDPLLAAGSDVDYLVALLHLAAVHPEIGELAHVGVAHDLERQRTERSIVVGGPLAILSLVGSHNRGDVQR